MAALLGFTDQIANLSSSHFQEFYSDEPPELNVCDYAGADGALRFDESCLTFAGEPETAATAAVIEPRIGGGEEVKRRKVEAEFRIGFRTKSEVEILDDGFKWRKYGKKAVKNSPNPRNYYRCASTGCGVKKRVERDRNDRRYVITIYEGTHNHEGPDVICHPFITYELPSSSFASCGQMKPTMATNFNFSSNFTPNT